MADNSVFITGAADGAFAKALDGLPPWATENTAKSIESYLKKSFDVQSKSLVQLIKSAKGGSGAMSPEELKKANDELEVLVKSLRKGSDQNDEFHRKAKKRAEKEEAADKKEQGSSNIMSAVMNTLAVAGTHVTGVFKDYVGISDSLFTSGINVLNGNDSTANSMEGLQQMVTLTGVRLQNLQKTMEKYSSTINSVGALKFAKAISLSNTQLTNLGYSSEAQTELVATLMESQRAYGGIQNKSAKEISADAVRLGNQLTTLSTTVGMSREQLQQSIKETSKSGDSVMIAATFGKDAADKVNQFVAGIEDANLKNAVLSMASQVSPVFSEMYMKMQQSGMGNLAAQLGRIAEESKYLDPADSIKRLKSFAENITDGELSALRGQLANGSAEARATLESIAKLKYGASGVSNQTDKQADAAKGTQSSLAALATEVEKAKAIPQMMFAPMREQLDLLSKNLGAVNNAIISKIDVVSFETRSWIGFGLAIIGAIASIGVLRSGFGMLGNSLSKIAQGAGPVAKSVSFIGSSLGNLGGMLLRFAGPIAAAYAAFQLGAAIGETIYEAFTGTTVNLAESFEFFLKDVFGLSYDSITKFVSELFDGVKQVGKWLSEIKIIKDIVDWITKFVSGVTGKFLSKMTGGLIGNDTSGFVTNKNAVPGTATTSSPTATSSTAAPTTRTPSPSSVSTSTGPSNPAQFEEERRRQVELSKSILPPPPALNSEKSANDGINRILEQQKALLADMLERFDTLVSVNKDILRYTRQQ